MTPVKIDPTDPFTRNILRFLATTLRAQPDETAAEYAERFATAITAFAALGPRDPVEQMLAVQIVAAQFAGLDCLSRAMDAEDAKVADRLRRSSAAMNRAVVSAMRLLDKYQARPDDALAPPPPAIEPIPPLRRRIPEEKVTQKPMHREKPRVETPPKDPAKMSDEELNAALDEMRVLYIAAMRDPEHPWHQEAMNIRPEDLPEGVLAACQAELDALSMQA